MQILEPQQFASWAEPIEMLYACHGRVKRFCRQLAILPGFLAEHGCNQAVKNDVKQILTYFNQAAPLHHEDEEKDFFPVLLKYVPQAKADIDELERQHEILHANWAALSAGLEVLINGLKDGVEQSLIDRFIAGYDVHIALEEPLFEAGKTSVPANELSVMGYAMAQRRKI